MRNVYCFVLFLAVAGVSSGGFFLEVDSDTIAAVMDVWAMDYDLAIQVHDGAEGGDLLLGAVTFNPALVWDFSARVHAATQTPKYVRATASQFNLPTRPGELFQVGFTGAGVVDLIRYNREGQATLVQSIFVPEPMMLGLLGFGVLFLRRRRSLQGGAVC